MALTRRGLLGSGAAGAAALGLGACGDDYFEPATRHDKDAPNTLMLITDSTRFDYIRAYNPDSLAKTPNIDALVKDSLSFSMAVPEAMPTGPARRALLTGVRSFPYRNYVPTKGLPIGPGWIPIPDTYPIVTEVAGEAGIETAYCTDNPFLIGPRFANFRRTVDWVKPSFSQGAYRFLNKPFKRLATRSQIERYLLPELSDSVEVGRLRSMVGWNSIYRDNDRQYPAARVVRAGINLIDDLKKKRPFYLGVDSFDPHEPFDAPRVYQLAAGSPKGIETTEGITPIQPFETPYSWVVHVDLDDASIERVRELYAAEITLRRRVDRAADEQARRREPARRDRHLLHVRPRADAGRERRDGQGRRPRAVAHLPRARDDPAPRGQARRADERLLRLDPRRVAHAALVHGRAGAGDDGGRGPVGAVRGPRAAARASTSPPATTTTCSAATATGSCCPTARGAASACTTSATTRRSCTTWPPSTRRSSTSSGGSSRTRPAARCRSSARPARGR